MQLHTAVLQNVARITPTSNLKNVVTSIVLVSAA